MTEAILFQSLQDSSIQYKQRYVRVGGSRALRLVTHEGNTVVFAQVSPGLPGKTTMWKD